MRQHFPLYFFLQLIAGAIGSHPTVDSNRILVCHAPSTFFCNRFRQRFVFQHMLDVYSFVLICNCILAFRLFKISLYLLG
jgi:hypothetical protein